MNPDLLARAERLHASAPVLDLHADTFLAVRYRGADIGQRHMAPIGWAPFMLHCDLPRWREGGVKAQGLGVVATKLMTRRPLDHARETIDLMHRTFDRLSGEVALAGTPDEVEAHSRAGKLAVFLGLEGGHMYGGDLAVVREFHEKGVRYTTLCHFFTNDLCVSSADKRPPFRGLTPFGKEAIAELNRLGALVDVAHVHEASFFAAIEASRAPVIVSHGGCRALRDHHRNVTDDQLHAIKQSGGVVGIIFFPHFLARNPLVSLERIVDHLEHVKRTIGAEHAALGSDMDGFVWMPRGLKDVSALPRLTLELVKRGFTDDEVRGILGGNFLRVWRRATELAEKPSRSTAPQAP